MRKAIVFILLLGSPLSYAVLSATTANTIQGNKPALIINSQVITSLDELLTITAPDGNDISTSQTVITVDQQHLINQFQTVFPADSSSHTLSSAYFHDQDSDTPHPFWPVSGIYQATLSYFDAASGYDIIITDLNQPFDACIAPYTLTIKADHVKVESEYGDPRVNPYGTQTRQIQIKVNGSGICYVRSDSRTTSNSWAYKKIELASGIHPTRGGYYYPDQLLTRRGFVPYLNPAFPTTGFKGATFRLVMPNAQTDYTYWPLGSVWVKENNGTHAFVVDTYTGEIDTKPLIDKHAVVCKN